MKCEEPGCNEPKDHIHLRQEDLDAYKAIHEAAQMAHAGSEIERTRSVNIHDHQDLLDHLKSNNGHMMGAYADWRNTHGDDHIPGVRPSAGDDRQMTHQELIALHHHDHNQYTDMPHTTLDGEHFHH